MRKMVSMCCIILLLSVAIGHEGSAQELVLSAGIAKTDITPTESLYMGGYDSNMRTGPSEGTYGNIYIRALVFDDTEQKVAFVETNIVSYGRSGCESLRELISSETGLPYENVILGSTHNHAAPTISGRNEESAWCKEFNGKLVSTVEKAMDDLEPVIIGGGVGHSNIAMNRRKRMEDTLSYLTFDENNSSQSAGKFKTDNPVLIHEMEGVMRLGSNPAGPIDDEVGIIRIDTMSGKPKAVFINYACHGTSLGGRNRIVSPEWMGHMMEYVEGVIPVVTCIFAQGAAGDINPRFVGGLDGHADDLEATAKLGYEIGKEVVNVYRSILPIVPTDPKIRVVTQDIECPLAYRRVMEDFKHPTFMVPTTGVRIDDFTWVTFPGEMFHEIGRQIKASTHANYAFLVGYCNGHVGYFPTQKAFGEGGYEPSGSRFAPPSEHVYMKQMQNMLLSLYQ